jgi:hypothetical protein
VADGSDDPVRFYSWDGKIDQTRGILNDWRRFASMFNRALPPISTARWRALDLPPLISLVTRSGLA